MKPIYLEMSAFGSYGKKEIIDFSNVDRGIFLITGDTGAGKTTIFDAITYALYDKTSGGKRDGEMMRSQYASDDTKTYVKFRFQYNQEEYEILRSPRQERMSKKKNAKGEYPLIVEQPSVDLFLADGTQFHGKIRDTNRKIEEIIGLDIDQFTQIAMIAQGDFLKLLQASSKERKEIFQKIFDTRIYWLMEQELSNRMKQVWGQLADNRKNIEREVARVLLLKDSQYLEEWNRMGSFTELKSVELMDILDHIIQEEKEEEKSLQKVQKKKNQELQDLILKIQDTEKTNEAFDLLEESQTHLQKLKDQEELYHSYEEELEKGRKALRVQHAQQIYLDKHRELEECTRQEGENRTWIAQEQVQVESLTGQLQIYIEETDHTIQNLSVQAKELTESLSQYQIYDQVKAAMDAQSKSLKEKEEQQDVLGTNQKKWEQEQEKLQLQQNELQRELKAENERKEEIRLLGEKVEGLQNMLQLYHTYQTAEEDYQEKETDYREQEDLYEKEKTCYQEIFQKFLDGQAQIMGERLQEGQPCPVCGSLHHPNPTSHQDCGVTREQLDSQEKNNQKQEKVWKKALDQKNKAEKVLESNKQVLLAEGRRVLGTDFSLENLDAKELELDFAKESSKKEAAEQAYEALCQQKEQYEKNQEQIQKLQKNMEQCKRDQEENALLYQEEKIAYEKNATRQEELGKRLSLNSESEAQEKIEQTQRQMTALQRDKKKRTTEAESRRAILQERQGQLTSQMELKARLTTEEAARQKDFLQELELQSFENQKEYEKYVKEEKELQELQKMCEQYKTQLTKTTERTAGLEKQLEGKQRIDAGDLKAEQKEKGKEKKELEKESRELYSMLTINRGVHQNVEKEYEARKKTEEQYRLLKRLSDTANGKRNGYHINFQTYIQRKYFREVIREANKRLRTMSRDQFILQCKAVERLSKMGEAGLDLDVYSALTDKTRDVKTLSGGESFMASLAMALGMSDIIQQRAGRIQIDTMFIDEGFGTLSDEVRNQAIQILQELSGGSRLIGIISHVSELKSQIDRKLVVTKTAKGSHVKWEL